MRWYFPSWNGDIRIRATDDGRQTVMTIIEPTAHELEVLAGCQNVFRAKGFMHGSAKLWKESGDAQRQEVTLDAPLLEIGLLLVGRLKPGVATLTAVTYESGIAKAMGSGEAGYLKWIAEAMKGDVGEVFAEASFRDTEGYAEKQALARAEEKAKQAEKEKAARAAEIEEASKRAANEAKEEAKKAEASQEGDPYRPVPKEEKKVEKKVEPVAASVKRPTSCCPGRARTA